MKSKELVNIFKPNYKIKIKSERYPIDIFLTKCEWNEIKKDKFVLYTTIEPKSNRYYVENGIILLMKNFEKSYDIYVYIEEKKVLLPTKHYKIDDKTKTIYIFIP